MKWRAAAPLALLQVLLVAVGAAATLFIYEPVHARVAYSTPEVAFHLVGSDTDVISRAFGVNLTSYTTLVKASSFIDTVCNPLFDPGLVLYSPRLDATVPLCWVNASAGYGYYRGGAYYDPVVSLDPGTGSFYLNASVSDLLQGYGYFVNVIGQPFIYFGGGYGVDDNGSVYVTFAFNGEDVRVYGYVDVYAVYIIYDLLQGNVAYADGYLIYSSYSGVDYLDGIWHTITFSYIPSDIGLAAGGIYIVFVGIYVVAYTWYYWIFIQPSYFEGYMYVDVVHHYMPIVDGYEAFYLMEPVFRVDYGGVVYSYFNATIDFANMHDAVNFSAAWLANYAGFPVGYNVNISDVGLDIGLVGVYTLAPAGAAGYVNLSLAYYHEGVRVEYPVNVSFVDPQPVLPTSNITGLNGGMQVGAVEGEDIRVEVLSWTELKQLLLGTELRLGVPALEEPVPLRAPGLGGCLQRHHRWHRGGVGYSALGGGGPLFLMWRGG